MSLKRKADPSWKTGPKGGRKIYNVVTAKNSEVASANRAAAVLIRQARMSAMPVQRNGVNDRGYVDLLNPTMEFDTTGNIFLLATIPVGASTNQRVGKKIMYASIQMRGRLYARNTATINDTAFIIVYDKRPTGTLPAITDVLVSANANSLNNDDNTGRFQIVRRMEHILLGNALTPSTGLEMVQLDDFIKFRRPVVYKSVGTGAIGDIEEGALYGITVGSNVAGTTAGQAVCSFRVRFTET